MRADVFLVTHGYAKSRNEAQAAIKLAAALDHFALSPKGRTALDLGASTGGFTQILLERVALKVHAVDVGHGQMAPSLAADPRVALHEGLNARDLTQAQLGEAFSAITADLSFISLKLALPPALALAARGTWAVFLVKPQFEAGRKAVGKGGIVHDEVSRKAALESVTAFVARKPAWQVLGAVESPLKGGDGNVEYLLAATKS